MLKTLQEHCTKLNENDKCYMKNAINLLKRPILQCWGESGKVTWNPYLG